MHAYAGPACICRMHAPSMLIPPTQIGVTRTLPLSCFDSRPAATVDARTSMSLARKHEP